MVRKLTSSTKIQPWTGPRFPWAPYLPCVPVPRGGCSGESNFSVPSLQIYPDESHYFHSASLKQHLYRSIINFFVECFRIQDKLPTVTAKEDEEDD